MKNIIITTILGFIIGASIASVAFADEQPETYYLIDFGKYDIGENYRDSILITCADTKEALLSQAEQIVSKNVYWKSPNPKNQVQFMLNKTHDWVIETNQIFARTDRGPMYNLSATTQILDKDNCKWIANHLRGIK